MDLQLAARERILLPFRAKPAPFLRFAYGAVSLLAILPVKFMAVLAVGLSRVDGRNRGAVDQCILGCGHKAKVLRIDARPIFADVVHHHSRGNLPMDIEPRHPVRAPVLPAKKECPVSISVKRAEPQEAAVGLDGVFVGESQVFCVRKGHVHLHCVAQGIMARKVKSNDMV